MASQPGFFAGDERLKALSAAGDPLERRAAVIDCAVFRGELEAALERHRSKCRRSPCDVTCEFAPRILHCCYY
jgi:transposase, IS5 family